MTGLKKPSNLTKPCGGTAARTGIQKVQENSLSEYSIATKEQKHQQHLEIAYCQFHTSLFPTVLKMLTMSPSKFIP